MIYMIAMSTRWWRAAAGAARRITDALEKIRDAMEAESKSHGSRGAKFATELRRGTLDIFYQGVTGLIGEPHVDLVDEIRTGCWLH